MDWMRKNPRANTGVAAANFKGDFQEMSVRAFSEMTYYSALSWEKLGQTREGEKSVSRSAGLCEETAEGTGAKIDYFATSLPTMLLFDDDLQFRQETTALFLQAQAHLGFGQKDKGQITARYRAAARSESCVGG